jgi:uncharacterized protein YndB with AHSA1/START domain
VNAPDLKTTLNLRRTVDASQEQVFRAWTDSEALKKWFGPQGFTTFSAEIDLQIGGKYRLGMQAPDGSIYYASGHYEAIHPAAKLVFTWAWEGSDEKQASLVTLDFVKQKDRTEIILTHERLASETARDSHAGGWNDSLNRLAEFVR